MKTLFVFLLGLAFGAIAMHLYRDDRSTRVAGNDVDPDASASLRHATNVAIDRTREAASDFSDAVSDKMREWRLSPDEVRAELGRTGEIVRENAAHAGERVADARIVAVIKAKLILDRELSAMDIDVDAKDGRVTLTGSLGSEKLVGKAVAHALDTDGVRNVNSKITVK